MQTFSGPAIASSFLQKFLLAALCLNYMNSGWHKFRVSGLEWDASSTLTCLKGPLPDFSLWIISNNLVPLVNKGTLAFEILMPPVAIIVRSFRPYFFLFAPIFHIGIFLTVGLSF